MAQFKLGFDHRIFVVDTVANVNWGPTYKAQKLLEKAKITEEQEERILSRAWECMRRPPR